MLLLWPGPTPTPPLCSALAAGGVGTGGYRGIFSSLAPLLLVGVVGGIYLAAQEICMHGMASPGISCVQDMLIEKYVKACMRWYIL